MEPVFLQLSKEEQQFGPRTTYQKSVSETFPAHSHDFYEVFLVTDGKAIHSVNDKRQLLSKGSLVYMRPSDVHSYQAINYFDFQIVSIGYSFAEIEPVLNYLGISKELIDAPDLPIHLSIGGESFTHLKHVLIRHAKLYPSSECRPAFRAFASELYAPLLLNDSDHIHTRDQIIPNWLYELDLFMSNKENYVAGLPALLSHCNYSKEHINRSFQKYYQMTPTEYINQKRMTYACELLLNKQHSITEICYLSGFHNLGHFYSVFRSIYHCTPREFMNHPVDSL